MNNARFHLIASAIVRLYQTDELPTPHLDDDIYVLMFDHELKIHLIGTQQGYLNMVATFPAHARWRTEKGFIRLLRENLFRLSHPVMQIGLDESGHHLVLSTRQPLDELMPDNTIAIFRAFLRRATDLYTGDNAPVEERAPMARTDTSAKAVNRMAETLINSKVTMHRT